MENAEGTSTEVQDDAEMEAAFAASFNGGEPDKVIEQEQGGTAVEKVGEEPEAEAEAKPAPAAAATAAEAPGTQDQIDLKVTIQELERKLSDMTKVVDRTSGQYGEVNRTLAEMKKAAATPQGAAAFQNSPEADYIDKEFPELAGGIAAKIKQATQGMGTGMSEDDFEKKYSARREREEIERRNSLIQELHEEHPDRIEIQKTPEWATWFGALPSHKQRALKNSDDPNFLSGMLHKFKESRDKAAKETESNQKRLTGAVTPRGTRPPSPSTKSADEEAQAAFDAQFK